MIRATTLVQHTNSLLQFTVLKSSIRKTSFDIVLSTVTTSTDIANITRKRSKPDKHGHGKGKRIQKPGECYQRYEDQTDMSVRGTRWQDTSVRVRGQACMDPCQSLAIMRRLVKCKKSIIPLDPAISLDEDLKGQNCPSHLEAINGARISCI
ncbi:hypothetical protein Tco_1000812 [Tanacetum coccineum]